MRTADMVRAPIPPGYLEWKLESACPVCGERKLLKRFDQDRTLGYRCENCGWTACVLQSRAGPELTEHALSAACPRCRTPGILSRHDEQTAWVRIEFHCGSCGWRGASSGQ